MQRDIYKSMLKNFSQSKEMVRNLKEYALYLFQSKHLFLFQNTQYKMCHLLSHLVLLFDCWQVFSTYETGM